MRSADLSWYTPERVVLQRARRSEHRHDAVAGELVDRAAVTLHHLGAAVNQFGHDFAQPLRTHRRGDVHGMHHVGEQHRHLLVLRRCSGSLDRRAALVAERESGGSSVPHDPHNSPAAVMSRGQPTVVPRHYRVTVGQPALLYRRCDPANG